jgi:hypothetical protein
MAKESANRFARSAPLCHFQEDVPYPSARSRLPDPGEASGLVVRHREGEGPDRLEFGAIPEKLA